MKKLVVCLLTAMLLLAGCSSSSGTTTEAGSSTSASGETPTLKFAISTLMVVPSQDAVTNVENVMNDYLASIGENYKVDLEIIAINDYFTTVPMALSGKEGAPDIIQVFSLADFVSQGFIQNLTPYLDNELKPTVDLIGNVIGSGKIAGDTYMIPRYFGTVLDWKFIYNKALIEESGVDLSDCDDLYTLEDKLAELKEVYPDEHFLVYTDQFDDLINYYKHTSVIGTYTATEGDSTKLVNYYETEAYKEAIEMAYRFRQKGYVDPEGSANTLSHDVLVMSGSAKGVLMGHSANEETIAEMFNNMATYDAEFGAKTIGIGDLYTDTLGVGISYTCANPELAASFINLLYTDEFVWDTLIYGIEGQDFVWDENHEFVNYPEGLDGNTIPYTMQYSCGMIGNGFQGLPFASNSSGNDFEYGKELMKEAWCPPLYGFTPTSNDVMNEATAVNVVVEKYNNVLTYGDVDPADVYPQFIEELKAAGIDKLIENYQAQVDAWVAENN
ncbi:MAG: extracellular solute-binding protein [Erysipelotrichaceae bacterium]|nr:extracellular solute-binding protein [Erysipelotrichaceae bacterium]